MLSFKIKQAALKAVQYFSYLWFLSAGWFLKLDFARQCSAPFKNAHSAGRRGSSGTGKHQEMSFFMH